MNAIQTWVKTLPPALQTFYYAVESALVVAVVLLLTSLYAALQTPAGLAGFDWGAQVHTAIIAALTGVVKALLDLLKGTPPTQQTGVQLTATNNGPNPPSSPVVVSPISSSTAPTHRGLVADPPPSDGTPAPPPAQGA